MVCFPESCLLFRQPIDIRPCLPSVGGASHCRRTARTDTILGPAQTEFAQQLTAPLLLRSFAMATATEPAAPKTTKPRIHQTQCFIGGQWVPAQSGKTFDTCNPAT